MDQWIEIENARKALSVAKEAIDRVTQVRDELDNMSLQDLARLQMEIGGLEDELSEAKTVCTKFYDRIRMGAIPNRMDGDGVSNITVKGVGRVTLVPDLHASIKSGEQPRAFEWLQDRGHGDLIKPTINPSTLKAFVKRQMADGEALPSELFNVSPFTRAQITKV